MRQQNIQELVPAHGPQSLQRRSWACRDFYLSMTDDEQQKATRWTAQQRKYMLYVATPKEERTPLNEGNYAAENGINRTTLWKWKNLPGFYAEVNKLVDEHLADDYAEIVDSFKRQAKMGSYNHQKMYLELIGKYTPKQDVGGDIVIRVVYEDGANAEGA